MWELIGKKCLVGDLNLVRGRNICYSDEGLLLSRIEQTCDLEIRNNQKTRTDKSSGTSNQLDYYMDNVGATVTTSEPIAGSDHSSLVIDLHVSYELEMTDEVFVYTEDRFEIEELNAGIEFSLEGMLDDVSIKTDEIILQGQLLLEDTIDMLAVQTGHIIKPQLKIKGKSRQISTLILDENIPPDKKADLIYKRQAVEVSNILGSSIKTARIGEKINSVVTLRQRGKGLNKCQIEPREFKDQIIKNEEDGMHNNHCDEITGKLKHLVRIPGDPQIEQTLKKIRSKWKEKTKMGWSSKFWRRVMKEIQLSERDNGCQVRCRVKPIEKNLKKLDQKDGYRLVWLSDEIFQKAFDMCRTTIINPDEINNHGYLPARSTISCHSNIACWRTDSEKGVLGIDYSDAFAKMCRGCLNDGFGDDKFLNEKVKFFVNSDRGDSEAAISLLGSGAGRASGGLFFITGLDFILKSNQETKKQLENGFITAYADDSEVLVPLQPEKIESIRSLAIK